MVAIASELIPNGIVSGISSLWDSVSIFAFLCGGVCKRSMLRCTGTYQILGFSRIRQGAEGWGRHRGIGLGDVDGNAGCCDIIVVVTAHYLVIDSIITSIGARRNFCTIFTIL